MSLRSAPSSRQSPEPDSPLRFPPGAAASKAVGLLAASRGPDSWTPIASAPPHAAFKPVRNPAPNKQTAIFSSVAPRKTWPSQARIFCRLRQQRANVQTNCVEDFGAEAILLHFGFPDEIAHRCRAEATEESEDCTFLNYGRRMSAR